MAIINTPLILDGKALAQDLRKDMALEIKSAVSRGARAPALAVILVGDDAASQVYVRNKQKACNEVGIISVPFFLSKDAPLPELLTLIATLNSRDDIDGVLLQLPLPGKLNAEACIEAIDPNKDVDGFHPLNMGKLALGLPTFTPCTPAGVLKLLQANGLSPAGKKAVVIGRSNIVGKPLALLLARKDIGATVTLCHSGTADLARECLEADFIFAAAGKRGLLTADMVKPGAVVVDIGINRDENGLCGDVDFKAVAAKAKAITPVPGGVGPMTIAMLLANTIQAWKSTQNGDRRI